MSCVQQFSTIWIGTNGSSEGTSLARVSANRQTALINEALFVVHDRGI